MSCCSSGTNIFSAAAGTVVAVDGSAVPIEFSIDNDSELLNSLKAIATSIGVQAQGGHQFMHALRNTIYVYVFTERVGELVVNGLAFPGSCEPLGPNDDEVFGPQYSTCNITALTGIERVIQWYECNRITSRARPIKISLGPVVFYNTFLVSMKAEIVNADTGIAQFSYHFATLPNVDDGDADCFEDLDIE